MFPFCLTLVLKGFHKLVDDVISVTTLASCDDVFLYMGAYYAITCFGQGPLYTFDLLQYVDTVDVGILEHSHYTLKMAPSIPKPLGGISPHARVQV